MGYHLQHRPWKINPATALAVRTVGRWLCRGVERFVFLGSTGRSGTQTLAELLDHPPHCRALHEPYPQPAGDVLQEHLRGDSRRLRRLLQMRKLPNIYKAARGHRCYVETSHLFIFSYADMVFKEFGPRTQFIHLVRDRHAVARSFYKRGQDPRVDPWLIRPDAPTNIIHIDQLNEQETAWDHRYLRLLWYWYEVQARSLAFAARHPQMPTRVMRTEQLNDREHVAGLLAWLGLDLDPTILNRVGLKANASKGSAPQPPDDVDETLVSQLEGKCRAAMHAAHLVDPLEEKDGEQSADTAAVQS
jgi:hypothetical protein